MLGNKKEFAILVVNHIYLLLKFALNSINSSTSIIISFTEDLVLAKTKEKRTKKSSELLSITVSDSYSITYRFKRKLESLILLYQCVSSKVVSCFV